MILRIKIQTPELVTGSICGTTLSLLDVDIVVNVNGVEVLNYTGGGVAPDFHEISIPTIATWEENVVEITCSMTGYHTYHNIFTVYGYDLGHDTLVRSNYPFEIIMVEEDYRTILQRTELIDDGLGNMIPNPDYIPYPIQLVYASVIAYRRPFTNEIHYYKSSNFGDVSYYSSLTGAIFSTTGNGVICNEDDFGITPYYFYMGTQGGCCCSPQPIMIDECLRTEVKIKYRKWTADVSYSFSSTNCDNSCINNLDSNVGVLYIDFSQVNCIIVDDVAIAPFIDLFFTMEVWGVGSIIVDNVIKGYIKDSVLEDVSDYVTFTCPINVHTIVENGVEIAADGTLFKYEWNFTTPDIGDFIINSTVYYDCLVGQTLEEITPVVESIEAFKNYSVLYCDKLETLSSCNWYKIEQTDCSNYKVSNHSFDEVELNVYKLNSDKEWVLQNTETISECNVLDVNIVNDGVYKFTVTKGESSYTYLVINYCVIQNCYLNYLKGIICCNPADVCATQNVYDYNTFHSLVNVLMAQLNSEYNFNFIYEFISDEKLDELHNISAIIDRINTEYCSNCNSPSGCDELINSNCNSCN